MEELSKQPGESENDAGGIGPSPEIATAETSDAASDSGIPGDGAVPEAPDVPSDPPRKRPVWVHLIVLFFQILFLTPLYAAIAIAAVGAGVGWHYFDGSAGLDLELVGRPEIGAVVKDAKGSLIGRAGSMNRLLITRGQIPPHFVDALVSAEDQRFFVHPGFDPVGSVRAAWANYRAEAIREGGSTLTQQLARDVYRLEGKDIDRKLSEIAAAVRIEKRYTKDEILVHYLNRVYFGSGFYGLGSAAQGYFSKDVSALSIDESALLCGLIPSPSRYSPFVNVARAKEYRDQTLRRMNEIGKLPKDELDRLLALETPVASSREDSLERGQISYLLARIERELREDMKSWASPPKSLDGYTIETSVDLDGQQDAAKEMDRHLLELTKAEAAAPANADPLEAAFVLLENRTGQVVISVGSRDYQRSEYDRAVEMKRPPGSAFFPILYAAAFETGHFTPQTVLLDAPFDNREMGLGAVGGILGEWSTENPANRWDGEITAAEALTKSKNSPTARLALLVGLERVDKVARASGISTGLRDMPGSLLGASEASLTELTKAYTVFPNGGSPAQSPRLIREVRDAGGHLVSRPAPAISAPAMKESTARAVASALVDSTALPHAKGKSGTTATFTDVWHFGFDETHTWGVWIGRDRFTPIRPLAFGGELAKPLAEAIVSDRKKASAPVAASEKP